MTLLTDYPKVGNHKIEGIGDDFIPNLVNLNIIDKIYEINDDDAVNMARKIHSDNWQWYNLIQYILKKTKHLQTGHA